MIERGETGGTCVSTGCVPFKALLAAPAAPALRRLATSEALRLAAQSFSRDVTKLSCCAA
jgi:pyruvate/2-oxoglutarate dehydrogenase complex dihydrolipoamide dehydrogenase (E3) component